jgi:hypothetical protein
MGIEPTRRALPGLENKQFRAIASVKCNQRVNFRDMRDHVGIREQTSATSNVSDRVPRHL